MRFTAAACDAQCAAQVRVEHLDEVVVAHAQDETVCGDPGVRHEHLDVAQLLFDLLERRFDVGGVGDVARDGERVEVGRWW